MSTSFIIRVRHSKGTTRLQLADGSASTIRSLKQLISQQLSDKPSTTTQELTLHGTSTDSPLNNNATLSSLHLNHGDMLYLKIIPSAIICRSNPNHNTNQPSSSLRRSTRRKRKFDEIESATQSSTNHNKRSRISANRSNSRFVVHTISNTSNTSNTSTTASTAPAHSTQNTASTTNTTSSGRRVGQGRSLGNATNTSKKTEDDKKKLKKKPSKKKKKKKKKDEFLMIKSEGDSIEDIVNNYRMPPEENQLNTALRTLPAALQATYAPEARVEAILDERVEVTEQLESSYLSSRAKSYGKLHLVVMYSYHRRKRKECVCYYDEEKTREIVTELIWTSVEEAQREQTFVKNKINQNSALEMIKQNELTIPEMANRSPPLLWSLFHANPEKKIEDVVCKLVKSVMKDLRNRATQPSQENDTQ